MTKYMLCKIKKGKRQIWLDWCNELMTTHKEEAALTLTEEDLTNEMCLVFGEGDNSFVVYRHTSLPNREKKPSNKERSLNLEHHRKFDECLEIMDKVPGYDIDASTH